MTGATFIPLIAVIGLAVGSFLNVAIDRLPTGASLIRIPSHCATCQRRIALYDLVPLLNYLWLQGRCRYCKASISPRVPIVEASTGAFFGWTAHQFGMSAVTAVVLINLCVFIVIFFIDLEHHLILNNVLLVALPLLFAIFPFGSIGSQHTILGAYLRVLEGTALGLGVMLLLYTVFRGGFGKGDVKLGALLGAATGFPQVLATFYLGFVSGGIVALALIVLRKRGRKDIIPFGPFLSAGVIAVILARSNLYDWYLALF